jgi:hypothetical protein
MKRWLFLVVCLMPVSVASQQESPDWLQSFWRVPRQGRLEERPPELAPEDRLPTYMDEAEQMAPEDRPPTYQYKPEDRPPTHMDDALITEKVKAALAKDLDASALAISVDTTQGTVQLSGTVESEEEKEKAESIARGVDGVKAVENKLTVEKEKTAEEAQTPMRHQVVRRVQRELQKQGYDPGTIDGKMGPRTRSTLKRYQTDHGLPATGEIDSKILETIVLRTTQRAR